jgi:16S rRNA (cytosine967-C5)-methyltransferase
MPAAGDDGVPGTERTWAAPAAVSPARHVAHRVLRRVTADDAWADRVFRTEAGRAGLDARERAFAQQLAYGTVQRLAPSTT